MTAEVAGLLRAVLVGRRARGSGCRTLIKSGCPDSAVPATVDGAPWIYGPTCDWKDCCTICGSASSRPTAAKVVVLFVSSDGDVFSLCVMGFGRRGRNRTIQYVAIASIARGCCAPACAFASAAHNS
ncbi:hypothetical protein K432DRAFT_473430 [Lepidopterella palustris CBS 459.81]|uniref:Uncharacterized protein n=1 Tax=Lepidopterella palustris CBS 459.81 TaxID=1314670 RepID=A0A8E2EEH1_9PEZI|nr:hypothetical protein K432DRAFT_473430 [Lepidopterella palustris CBS 459.81]